MFSIDFNSPAEPDVVEPNVGGPAPAPAPTPPVVPDTVAGPPVGVGEPVDGLGGGDLGLRVLLPGVTVSNAEPCDGAGNV